MRRNYYELLNISVGASQEEVKKGYREQVLKYHPDRPGGGDLRIFQEIMEAYEVLGDEDRRAKYDGVYGFRVRGGYGELIGAMGMIRAIKKKLLLIGKFFESIGLWDFFHLKRELIFDGDWFRVSDGVLRLGFGELRKRFEVSGDHFERLECLKGIIELEGRNGYLMIEKALKDEDYEVRKLGVLAVGRFRIRQGLYLLNEIYLKSELDFKKTIIQVIGSLKTRRSEEYIVQRCYDENDEIRLEALKCIRTYHLSRCISRVEDLLYDNNPEVQDIVRSIL